MAEKSNGPFGIIKKTVDRFKTVDSEDAKKGAAAAIGIWGGATALGWAMQRG